MIEHIKILAFFILLLSTLWLIFYINNTYKQYPYIFVKAIRNYIIVVLILLVLRFIFFYVRENLLLYLESNLSTVYLKILIFSNCVVTILGIYLMINILLSFNDKSFTKSQNIKVILIGTIITIFYIFTSLFPKYINPLYNWLDLIVANIFIFNLVIYNLEFLIIISFYFIWSRIIKDADKKRIGKLFALFYIICNSLSLLALIFIMQINISEMQLWIIQLFMLSIFIVAPFLWIKFVFIKYAQTMSRLINSNMNLETVYTKYSISEREKEIIQLIIDGKGNNEIKEKLFISYHTVKNHLSNIYRKLNVSNRHELIHLFIKNQKKNQT